jgi:2-keto-4-pentenoate hydratase
MSFNQAELNDQSHGKFEEAARQLIGARQSGKLISQLSANAQPHSIEEAHQIQTTTVSLLRDAVAGWKVANSPTGELMCGVVLASRVFHSPARIRQITCPMMTVEVEVAFRFTCDLPQRAAPYSHQEVLKAVQPFTALEVVDSRYANYAETPWLQRTADFMSNGAFVKGEDLRYPETRDLSQLEVALTVGGNVLVTKKGGHPAGDPFGPVVTLVNFVRAKG